MPSMFTHPPPPLQTRAQLKLDSPVDAPIRNYYIAAELVDWDYAPLGMDGCSGRPFTEDQEVFVKTTKETLGSKYTKAVFRPYTDATFTKRATHDPLYGILGPTLRAETGDKIVVHFLNKLTFNASVQVRAPHRAQQRKALTLFFNPGVLPYLLPCAFCACDITRAPTLSKPRTQLFGGFVPIGNTTQYQVNIGGNAAEAEAAMGLAPGATLPKPAKPAAGGARRLRAGRRLSQITAAQAEAEAVIAQSVSNIYSLGAVAPRGKAKYEWLVPDSAAPGPADGDAVAYAYVSGVDHIKHINAGLVGAVVIYNKGKMPTDEEAAKELPLLFNIQNEMQSELFERNLAQQSKASGLKIDNMVR